MNEGNHDPDGRGGTELSEQQRLDWLRLIRSDNVGPSTFRKLVNKFGGAGAALAALPGLIAKAGGSRKIRIADERDCEREYRALQRMGGRLIALGEASYPALLREISTAPPLVSVLGKVDVLKRPLVAIVGSRNASAAGLSMTERLVGELALAEYGIVSGLARGVDRQAHMASLLTGTVAVLAGGLDQIYPPEHAGLAEEICRHGALLSEMPVGWQARGRDFPRRNRIVSGLSYATIVVEAARRSGSLITARFANEQGREVFAVPGSPLDPRAEGPNQLLSQGATICLSGGQVAEVLSPMRAEGAPGRGLNFDDSDAGEPKEEDLWDETDLFGAPETPTTMAGMEFDDAARSGSKAIAFDGNGGEAAPDMRGLGDLLCAAPVSVDELVRLSGLSVAQVKTGLLDLELEGRLERHGGGLVSLKAAGNR